MDDGNSKLDDIQMQIERLNRRLDDIHTILLERFGSPTKEYEE